MGGMALESGVGITRDVGSDVDNLAEVRARGTGTARDFEAGLVAGITGPLEGDLTLRQCSRGEVAGRGRSYRGNGIDLNVHSGRCTRALIVGNRKLRGVRMIHREFGAGRLMILVFISSIVAPVG